MLKYFAKKKWASQVISFWNYRLDKVGLLKCLKGGVPENLWTINILKGPKDCLNVDGGIFFHIFPSLQKEISLENLLLVVSEILRLFVNLLTPDEKHSLSVKASAKNNQFKCNYLKIEKYFLSFLLHFRSMHKIMNTLKKKMSLKGYLFLKF